MLIVDKKMFLAGTAMAVAFLVVLFLMFTPLFGGLNAFEASDRLFNSIAKGSSNYFEDLRASARERQGQSVALDLPFKDEAGAARAAAMLSKAGVETEAHGARLTAAGDLGLLARAVLEDAEAMFHNRGAEVSSRYGHPEKQALFDWWSMLREARKSLETQENFAAAAFVHDITMRGVEVAYNFYGIEAQSAARGAGVLAFALVFYIVYTLWWGYAILYMFNGFGLEMKAGAKKEI